MPTLYLSDFSTIFKSGQENYSEQKVLVTASAKAEVFAYIIASRYKGKITHYELENEKNIYCWDEKNSGVRTEHFDSVKLERVFGVIKGLSKGVNKADPSANLIVNSFGCLHYGFIQRFINIEKADLADTTKKEEDKFSFDIIGWHWYSDVGNIQDTVRLGYHYNVADELAKMGLKIISETVLCH